MMPWESWPARLALTQPEATARASSSEAPAALSSAAPMRVRRSAWTIGMGFLKMPAREYGSCLLSGGHRLKRLERGQGQNIHAAMPALGVLRPRFHCAGNGAGRPAQETVNLDVQLVPIARGLFEAFPRIIGATFTLNRSLRPPLTPA